MKRLLLLLAAVAVFAYLAGQLSPRIIQSPYLYEAHGLMD